ncbi:hypothetical protein [Lignipirellula cremea]|uniref:Uncharacterized protein n=1 Tax=Lignipirellula cremea TaxID=2528010 RepID=A0A518DNX5_9BACT|nr:hypothetical protein [Lignipirellula cremea]QDU93539.1 hypothetical protein Pla8534_13190 [Lignipirellula cremea]
MFLWRRSPFGVEIREHGLVTRLFGFTPYARISSYHWGRFDPAKLILQIDRTQQATRVALHAPPQVDAWLQQYVRPRGTA